MEKITYPASRDKYEEDLETFKKLLKGGRKLQKMNQTRREYVKATIRRHEEIPEYDEEKFNQFHLDMCELAQEMESPEFFLIDCAKRWILKGLDRENFKERLYNRFGVWYWTAKALGHHEIIESLKNYPTFKQLQLEHDRWRNETYRDTDRKRYNANQRKAQKRRIELMNPEELALHREKTRLRKQKSRANRKLLHEVMGS